MRGSRRPRKTTTAGRPLASTARANEQQKGPGQESERASISGRDAVSGRGVMWQRQSDRAGSRLPLLVVPREHV